MPFPNSSTHERRRPAHPSMLRTLLNKLRPPEAPPVKPDRFAAYPDFTSEFRQVIERVQPYTMSSPDRMAAMYEAARYVAGYTLEGTVEETIPAQAPERIALLRLDTDWYESTRHELVHLYPRLVPGGVLIIDDYGHWEGARKAVDEYIAQNNLRLFLNRIDYAGRLAIKPS